MKPDPRIQELPGNIDWVHSKHYFQAAPLKSMSFPMQVLIQKRIIYGPSAPRRYDTIGSGALSFALRLSPQANKSQYLYIQYTIQYLSNETWSADDVIGGERTDIVGVGNGRQRADNGM